MIFAAITAVILGAVLIMFFICADRLRIYIGNRFSELTRGCDVYEAAVLDCISDRITVGKKAKKVRAVIVQFRIEEQKRTVVNRCTARFYGKYSRGDRIKLLFREEMPVDFSVIKGDNAYEHAAAAVGRLRMPSLAAGIIFLASGIAMLIFGGA